MQDFRMSTFLKVCRTLNYTRAAHALNITQPAVSQHIATLEKEYGTKLFFYKSKKLSLTCAGKLLRDAALTMAHDEVALRDAIASVSGARRSLRVGMTLTAGEYVLAQPLAAYLTTHPDVQVRLASSDTKRLIQLLRAGKLDCAFVEGLFDKSLYDWVSFDRERLVGVCAPFLAEQFVRRAVHFEDLLDQHVLVREEGSGTRAVFSHALAARNLSVQSFARITEIESINIMKRLLQSGYGIAFLYEVAVREELDKGLLTQIPLAGGPILHDVTGLWLKGSVFSAEYRGFFDDLRKARLASKETGRR